jgi:hypothetical protein
VRIVHETFRIERLMLGIYFPVTAQRPHEKNLESEPGS